MSLLGPIIVEPGTFDLLNLGDVAMLQAALCRLSSALPGAELRVLTHDEDSLAVHCPEALPISAAERREWFADRFFLGRLHDFLPVGASQRLVVAQQSMRKKHPKLMGSAMRLRTRVHRTRWERMRVFLDLMTRASMVVIAGQHTIADAFLVRARMLLETLEFALQRDIPTIMLGQGIGPLTDHALLAKARDVLPSVRMIAVREPHIGPPILRALGVADARILVTGDDAVPLAFAASRGATRELLGVSLRITPVAGVAADVVEDLRPVLRDFARAHDVGMVPLPSAYHGVAADEITLRRLLEGEPTVAGIDWSPRTVPALVAQVGRCRIVVAGAYHVAVFALSQGIPVVALASSNYYRSKYDGLETLFGAGCETVTLDDPMLEPHLRDAMERAWDSADNLRPRLLEAAERQVRWGEDAFARALDLLPSSPLTSRAG